MMQRSNNSHDEWRNYMEYSTVNEVVTLGIVSLMIVSAATRDRYIIGSTWLGGAVALGILWLTR
jgi:hypothetical protein